MVFPALTYLELFCEELCGPHEVVVVDVAEVVEDGHVTGVVGPPVLKLFLSVIYNFFVGR